MKLIVVGCGRVGARVATMMAEAGHTVTVIDMKAKAFDRLGRNFPGEMILGNGIDVDVLREAGIEEAQAFASLTNGDNRNIMAAQVAREIFKVPRVITRINDPIRANVFGELGLKAICPTLMGAEAIHHMLKG